MQTPAIPLDETSRLQSLMELRIVDTLAEERFDRVTRLACRAFAVPIALVSLVDSDRLWFKSRQGINHGGARRDVSFCAHAILEDGAMVVPDARLDARFADNPMVLGSPHIRFYAGHTLHGPGGYRVGSFCIIDTVPRAFSDEDAAVLADLAGMVDRELALVEHASTDELTQICNRRGFNMVASRVLSLCRRQRLCAAVVAIDLDNFKSVNDQHGHAAGDDVLRVFARLLQDSFRTSDVIGRLGGDEFVILCGGSTADLMAESLARLRAGFAESALARAYPGLAWSAGVAQFDGASDATIEDLLRTADRRMYRTKSAGRKRLS